MIDILRNSVRGCSNLPDSVIKGLLTLSENERLALLSHLEWDSHDLRAKALCVSVWLQSKGPLQAEVASQLPSLFNAMYECNIIEDFPTTELAAYMYQSFLHDQLIVWTMEDSSWMLGYAVHCAQASVCHPYVKRVESHLLNGTLKGPAFRRLVRAYSSMMQGYTTSLLLSAVVGPNTDLLVELAKYSRPEALGADPRCVTEFLNIIGGANRSEFLHAMAVSWQETIPLFVSESATFRSIFTQKCIGDSLSDPRNQCQNLVILLSIAAKVFPAACSRNTLDSLLSVAVKMYEVSREDAGFGTALVFVSRLLSKKGYKSTSFTTLLSIAKG